MRILVTNDDGIESEGIHELARSIVLAGYDVTIVAPLGEASGAGAGVGPVHEMTNGIKLVPYSIKGLESIPAYGIDALPALAVLTACLGGFGERPDVVVSGINRGLNTGRSVLHSGTVGAALTANHFGISAIAVSTEWSESPNWSGAATIAAALLGKLHLIETPIVLNLNAPSLDIGQIKGIRKGSLSTLGLIRTATLSHEEKVIKLDVTSSQRQILEESDSNLVEKGYASLTPIVGIREDVAVGASTEFKQMVESSFVVSKTRG